MLFLVIALFCTTPLFSQGDCLDRGQSGIGFGAYFSSSRDYSTMSGFSGYSISDIVDIGIAAGKVSYDKELAAKEIYAIHLSPNIEIHAFKQNEEMPFSISLFVSYYYHSYISDALDLRRLKMSAHGFSTGVTIYGNISKSEFMKIQPSVGAIYSSGKLELKESYGSTISNKKDETYYCLGISFSDKLFPTTIFRIHPEVFIHSDYTTLGIGAGIIVILLD
jgi:hypothetical protein